MPCRFPAFPGSTTPRACPQIPVLPVVSLQLPPCSLAWALVWRAAVLAGPREAAEFPKVPEASGRRAVDNSQPLRGHHAHRKAKPQEQKGRLKVATDPVPSLIWLAHFVCQLFLVFTEGRLGSLCHRQHCRGQEETRAGGAAQMGAGRVGSVAAKHRGGKAEERPVIVLTRQKGSCVTSAFEKN